MAVLAGKNTKMHYGSAILLICLFLACFSIPSYAADDKAARMAAAEAYEKAVPVESMMNDMMAEIEKNPELNLSADEKKIMRESYNVADLRQRMLDSIAKHFTVAEINALTTFYSSVEGKAIMKKFPVYLAEFLPYIQQQTMENIQKLMALREAKAQSQPK